MPNSIRRWMPGIALWLFPVVSCGDVVGPPTSGTYALQEVNGERLPVTWQPSETQAVTLLRDKLVLSSNRRFRRSRGTAETDLTTGITVTATEEWEGSVFRSDGSWVLLSDICGSDSLALCVAPPTVHTVASNLAIRAESPPQGTLLFSPVG